MHKLFFIFYILLSFILYMLAIPYILYLSFKLKYRQSIPARFFLWKNRRLEANGIWFHSCSFGEAKAIESLVKRLPRSILRMSTTTSTGYGIISKYTDKSRYLPFEPLLIWWIKPQKALVVMEAEFWYLMFILAQKRGAKTLLVNARMSENSYSKYKRFTWFYKLIFKHIDEVYTQTIIDKERLEYLGAKNVIVTGNIKLAHLPKVTQHFEKPEGLAICAGSTHESEERLILEAFVALKEEQSTSKMILVPRHPERFDKVSKLVEKMAKNKGLSWHRFSQDKTFTSDIVVVDSLGELINIYAICDIVILGGAFVPIGGHNAAEAAQFGCKIISGKHYFNQIDIFNAIEGIEIVEDVNLCQSLLDHDLLRPTKICTQSNIAPIIESLNNIHNIKT